MLTAALVLAVVAWFLYHVAMEDYRDSPRDLDEGGITALWVGFVFDMISRYFMIHVAHNTTGWHWEHYALLFGVAAITPIWTVFLDLYGQVESELGSYTWRFRLSRVYEFVWVTATVIIWLRVYWPNFG